MKIYRKQNTNQETKMIIASHVLGAIQQPSSVNTVVSTVVVELLDSTTTINNTLHALLLFFIKYIVYVFLNMMRFVGSWDSICLPSFMFLRGVVSEICVLNGKKDNLGNLLISV